VSLCWTEFHRFEQGGSIDYGAGDMLGEDPSASGFGESIALSARFWSEVETPA
jgi:hypothetical protein